MKMLFTALALTTLIAAPDSLSPPPRRVPATPVSGNRTTMVTTEDTHWRTGIGPMAGESSCERSRE